MEQIVYDVAVRDYGLLDFRVTNVEGITNVGKLSGFFFKHISDFFLRCDLIEKEANRSLLVLGHFNRFDSFPTVPQSLDGLSSHHGIRVQVFCSCVLQHSIECDVFGPKNGI